MRVPAWAVIAALVVVLIGLLWFVTRDDASEDTDDDTEQADGGDVENGRPGDTIAPNPPTTRGEGPPSSIPPSSIGTLEDPVPVGQAFVNGSYELQVDGAIYDADETLAETNPAHDDAPQGHQRVLVELQVTYLDDVGFIDTSGLFLQASDGVQSWTDIDADCGTVPDSVLDGLLVEAGGTVTGNACFTVPDDVDPLYLTIEGFEGPIYFALPEP